MAAFTWNANSLLNLKALNRISCFVRTSCQGQKRAITYKKNKYIDSHYAFFEFDIFLSIIYFV
jgi:hypothetical protein